MPSGIYLGATKKDDGYPNDRDSVWKVLLKFSVRHDQQYLVPKLESELGSEGKARPSGPAPSIARNVIRDPTRTTDMRQQFAVLRKVKSGEIDPDEAKDLVTVGRARPGRVDTGSDNKMNKPLSCSQIPGQLKSRGFRLVRLFTWLQPDGKRRIVSLTFEKEGAALNLDDDTAKIIDRLVQGTWGGSTNWDNPNGVVTLNPGGWLPDQAPKVEMTVEDDSICYFEIQAPAPAAA